MPKVRVTRNIFLQDRQGKTFDNLVNDTEQPFDIVLKFFNDADRQRRMEESEIYHDRSPLAGVVRELEAIPAVDQFLSEIHTGRSTRLRQAVGVLVRIIMEQRGWRKTGRKGSLGVRAAKTETPSPGHNTGGLAFWFLRGERYELADGMPFRKVRDRFVELNAEETQKSPNGRNGEQGRSKKKHKRKLQTTAARKTR